MNNTQVSNCTEKGRNFRHRLPYLLHLVEQKTNKQTKKETISTIK